MNAGRPTKDEFMAGMNVEGDSLREFPVETVQLLKLTRVEWVRVHTLPTRTLESKARNGISYLDGLRFLCRHGYNLIAPLDVGYTEVVGRVNASQVDSFVEGSYDASFQAAKRIAEVARSTGRRLIFGIENEINSLAWILQALPRVRWRESLGAWIKMATDEKLKFERLNSILKAARDAEPSSMTTTNVLAVDPGDFLLEAFERERRRPRGSRGLSLESIETKATEWKSILAGLTNKLDVDLISVDTYPNYLVKYPVLGKETGDKVDEAARLTGKPVFNAEFGYSTYRSLLDAVVLGLLGRPSAGAMQLEFFKNTLRSIETSRSIGTFPWVLMTPTRGIFTPPDEAYFGLVARRRGQLVKSRAFDYYAEWLNRRTERGEVEGRGRE